MSPRHRLASLRRHAIVRVGALWFIILIIVPFTAPFATIDIVRSHGNPAQAIPKVKGSDEQFAVVSDGLMGRPKVSVVEVREFTRSSQIEKHSALYTVLRL